jgi:uncharacterized protein YuzE
MEITRDQQADVLYIRFNERPFQRNVVLGNGLVVLDVAEDGSVIGIELISPATFVDNIREIHYRRGGEEIFAVVETPEETAVPRTISCCQSLKASV